MQPNATEADEAPLDQSTLFSNMKSDGVSIEIAARELAVSTATIRNWIKTGYLKVSRKNIISHESFERFKAEVIGAEKLTKRANKSQYDSHDHVMVGVNLSSSIGHFANIPIDELGEAYEQSLSNSYRNLEGIYYTPQEIAEKFFLTIDFDVKDRIFLDPCCGSGNFLIEALRHGFAPENIYGFDVDPLAVEIAAKRIASITQGKPVNLRVTDFLQERSSNVTGKKYDVIFTNPPWGKKLPKDIKELLANKFGVHKNTDTSGLFLSACLNIVRENGVIGMLMPDAFFNVASFQSVREKALALCVLQLTDYGKPFKGVLSGAKGIVLRNAEKEDGDVLCTVKGNTFTRKVKTFRDNPKLILNVNCSQHDSEVINFIMSKPHTSLSGRAEWGLGIVTGNNAKFAKPSWEPGYIAAYKGSEISVDGLKNPSVFIPDDLQRYQQVAPARLYLAEEKLIYKFISSKLVFYYDAEKKYVLNSANIVIPKKDFPVSMAVLAQYLSSNFINWYFEKIFSTHKVLRADIESIPIFCDEIGDMVEFDEEKFLSRIGVQYVAGKYFIK